MDGADSNTILSIVALVVAIASFVFSAWIKPRQDLKQGSLARRLQNHEQAVSALKKFQAVEEQEITGSLYDLVNSRAFDRSKVIEISNRLEEVQKRLRVLAVDVMNVNVDRQIEEHCNTFRNIAWPLDRIAQGEELDVHSQISLESAIHRDLPVATERLRAALEQSAPDRKPPLIRIETRRGIRNRAADSQGPPEFGC